MANGPPFNSGMDFDAVVLAIADVLESTNEEGVPTLTAETPARLAYLVALTLDRKGMLRHDE